MMLVFSVGSTSSACSAPFCEKTNYVGSDEETFVVESVKYVSILGLKYIHGK